MNTINGRDILHQLNNDHLYPTHSHGLCGLGIHGPVGREKLAPRKLEGYL